jgi:CDP-diacylglycerol--glycerol-3-phosphate 3-phosphatidyltransferase
LTLTAATSASTSSLLPRGGPVYARFRALAKERLARSLTPLAHELATAGISANVVTGSSLLLGALAGVLIACDHCGLAATALALASIGDALDGLVARETQTASVSGALFDASADRYAEFLVLGGLVILFRESLPSLVVVLAALVGSFMVSYGSAKAEAFGVPVPPGLMRRAERAVCLVVGMALVPLSSTVERYTHWPGWDRHGPILGALAWMGVVANASAIRRLRSIARCAERGWTGRDASSLNTVTLSGAGALDGEHEVHP